MTTFELSEDKTLNHLMVGEQRRVQDTMRKLINCACVIQRSGNRLPARTNRNGLVMLHRRGLARLAGLAPRSISAPAVCKLLPLLAKKVGLDAEYDLNRALEKCRAYERVLEGCGEKVPGTATGAVNFKLCDKAAGLTGRVRSHPRVRALLVEIARRRGIDFRHGPGRKTENEALLLAWERREVIGRGVPASAGRPDKPHLREVARQAGLPAWSLANAGPLRLVLDEIISRCGLYVVAELHGRGIAIARARGYGASLRARGVGLPSHDYDPGRRFLRRIADEGGFTVHQLATPGIARVLDELEEELGLTPVETVLHPRPEPAKTVAWLIAECDTRLSEPGVKPRKNFPIAMKRWRETAGEGALARDALETALNSLASGNRDRSELLFARTCLDDLDRQDLPRGFCEALRVARWRAGFGLTALARRIGDTAILRWNEISPGRQFVNTVERVEDELSLSRGTLTGRMRFRRTVDRRIEDASFLPRNASRLRNLVLQRLTEEDRQGDPEALRAKRDVLHEELISRRSWHSRMTSQVQRDPYQLTVWPHSLDGCLAVMVRAKTETSLPGDRLTPGATRWSGGTPGRVREQCGQFFGYLLRAEPGRPAVKLEDLSFGYLLFPALIEAYALWRRQRVRLPEDERLPPAGAGLQGFIMLCRSFLRGRRALLRQQPELLDGLAPIPGVVAPEAIAAARADWDAFCNGAEREYADIHAELRGGWRRARPASEAFTKVRTILSDPRPERAMIAMINRQRAHRHTLEPMTTEWATAVRDEAYLCLQAQVIFRGKTLAGLDDDFISDRGDEIWLDVPRRLFKNQHTKSVWKRGDVWIDYRERLRDRHGTYESIRLWREVARTVLAAEGERAFFCSARTGRRLKRVAFNTLCVNLTTRHLCFNAVTGLGDLEQMPFPNHCLRHIVATQVWRKTRCWRAVARVLRDTPEVAKMTYAFILENDLDESDIDPLDVLLAD